MTPLTLQSIRFDPESREIHLERDTHVTELYETTYEAFLHVNLLSYLNPMDDVTISGVTYYICSWRVTGAEVLEDDQHKLIEGILYDDER